MNYRHAFHAGNFADCVKHALLVWLVGALQRKPAAICVLDTHAGLGAYDLTTGPAERTGEWRHGIGRLLACRRPGESGNSGMSVGGTRLDPGLPRGGDDAPLAAYLDLVERLGLYPGSPALARALLRPLDRLVCCELHPEDCAALRARFAGDKQVAVHHRDGWEALRGLLPPKERRGLVLIDPPYEVQDEFGHLAAGLATAHARFPGGVVAAWYPVKHRAPVRAFHDAVRMSGLRDVVAAELWLREPLDPARLNGCGLLVVAPPYGFEGAAAPILDALLTCLSAGEPGAGRQVLRLVEE